jgi:hypothetical protein
MGAGDGRCFHGVMGGHSADAHETVALGDGGESRHAAQVDHFGGGGEAELHHGDEGHAAGQQLSFAAVEDREGLG